MKPLTASCLVLAIGIASALALAADNPPTADEIKALAGKFQEERTRVVKTGIDKHFLPALLEKADEVAKRGQAAMKGGRLPEARDAFRQARWQLPYQPARLPEHIGMVLGNLRFRHSGGVAAIAFSPDGTRLASAGADQVVRIWDMENGHEVMAYAGHTHEVTCVAFSPDGKKIASGGKENPIKVWDPATGKEFLTIKSEGIHTNSLVYSRDGAYLIAGHVGQPGQASGLVVAYEDGTGKVKRSVADFRLPVTAIAFNSDGSILGAGVADGAVRLWQFPTFVNNANQPDYWAQQDPGGGTFALAFSPDNRTLARLGPDGIKLYNLALPGTTTAASSPRRFIPLQDAAGRYSSLVFSKDGKSLFTGGADGTVKQWDTETGQANGAFKAHHGDIKAVLFGPAGVRLASASSDFTVRLWDIDSVRQARDFAGHEGAVWSSSFSPDGNRLVSAGADRAIRIWDIGSGKPRLVLPGHAAAVTAALFSPDGQAVISGGGDKIVKIWDAATGKPIRDLSGHAGTITALDTSRDGSRIVSGSADRTVMIWDAKTGEPLLTIPDGKSIVAAVAFSPSGKQIAVGHVDQTIRLYDAATGKQEAKWLAHGVAVSGLSYSPDGRWLASCGADHLARVWPLATPGQQGITLTGHAGPLSAVAFRADSRHLVTTGSDQTVKLWKLDGDTAKEAQTYRGHRDWVTSVAFSKDGYYVVSSGVDRVVKLWEITTRDIPLVTEHTGKVDTVAYSPDGKLIATGGSDKTIKIWDAVTGQERFTLEGHRESILSLTFTPNSKTLISSSSDRNIRLWDMDAAKAVALVPGQQQAFTGLVRAAWYTLVSADGKRLLVWIPAGDERYTTITAFDPATGAELISFNDPGRSIQSVAFSADGKWAAIGALDGSVRVFDLDKKGALLPGGHWFLYEKGVGLGDMALTPDGSILVAGSSTGDVKICLVARRETLKTIKAHEGEIKACQISADGKRFATAGADGIVKLWALDTGAELRSWNLSGLGTDSFTRPLAFSPDGKHLLAGNANTTAFVLDLP